MTRVALHPSPWPLATIDFEASSLEWDGYPIEVGVAVWQDANAPVLGWSTLICPPLAWREGGHWSLASAKVHGVTRAELLADGLSVNRVAARLNALLEPYGTAWCDGGRFDADWLRLLFRVAGIDPAFVLRDWADLVSDWDETSHRRARLRLATPLRHRARADAERLMVATAAGMSVPEPPLQTLPETAT